jgi:hypothetical protein
MKTKENQFIDNIIKMACTINNIKKSELLSSSRKRVVADTRICLANVFRKGLNLTQHKTGEVLGRDHASIHHYETEHHNMMSFNFYSAMFKELMLEMQTIGLDFGSAYRTKSDTKYIKLKQQHVSLKLKCKRLEEQLKTYYKIKELVTA